jgi:acetylornithine deacetylase
MADADLARRILKAVDDGFDAQVAFLADLTRLPSLGGQEAPAQDDGAHGVTIPAI